MTPRERFVVAMAELVPERLARRATRRSWLARLTRPIVNLAMPRTLIDARVRSGPGRDLILPLHPREEKYYWTGTHERAVQQVIANQLVVGETYWDVGAHIGFTALIASRAVGGTGTVHAFEPVAETRARLLRSIRLNHADNVRVHPIALAREDAVGSLVPHRSSTMWSVGVGLGASAGPSTVPVRSVDSLAAEIGRPDFIKIDVEGLEVDVLLGARASLASGTVALVEFTSPSHLALARSQFPSQRFSRIDDQHYLISE